MTTKITTIIEERTGTQRVAGCEWPVRVVLQHDAHDRAAGRRYTVLRGLTNGVPRSAAEFATFAEALEAFAAAVTEADGVCDQTHQTHAEVIADLLDNDGTVYRRADGRELDELARVCGAERQLDEQRDRVRYEFQDGSAIVDVGPGWDFGFPRHEVDGDPRCFCWPAVGHSDSCAWSREWTGGRAHDYVIAEYSATFDAEPRPRVEPQVGETAAVYESADGRETRAWRARCRDAGVDTVQVACEGAWLIEKVVEGSDL